MFSYGSCVGDVIKKLLVVLVCPFLQSLVSFAAHGVGVKGRLLFAVANSHCSIQLTFQAMQLLCT